MEVRCSEAQDHRGNNERFSLIRNFLLIRNRLGQVVHKAVWDLVAPREALGQPDLVVDRGFKAALGRLDHKGLREFKESKESQDRRGSRGYKGVLGQQDFKEFRASRESRESREFKEMQGRLELREFKAALGHLEPKEFRGPREV